MTLFDKLELQTLDSLWINPVHKKFDDREYYTITLSDYIIKPIIEKLLIWFENQTGLKLKTYNKFLILHRFYEGHFFLKHRDDILIYEKNRAYVVGFHLNDNYLGGEYINYTKDKMIDKTPGVPYLFSSSDEHEIKPILTGIRKSALIFINHEDLVKTRLV
jgi:hypothetical protein